MKELKSMADVFSSNSLMSTIPLASKCVSRAHRHERILRTMKGARAPLFQR